MLGYLTSTAIVQQPLTTRVWVRIALILVIFTGFWHAIRYIILLGRRVYPDKEQTVLRIVVTFVAGVIVASILSWLSGGLRYLVKYGTLANYHNTDQSSSFSLNHLTLSLRVWGIDLFQSIFIVSFYQLLYETMFFIQTSVVNQKRLKQAEREQEKLRTANLQSQLDALKQQVNPHFLFNSLNVLDSLIEDDPRQARVFLDELSSVYRYLLRSNEQHLTDLDSELAFINSYFHLLRTRHGMGLNLTIAVEAHSQSCQIPPLTLQLLVENAVKHNIVLPEQPLNIDILTNGEDSLQVRNNIQRKTIRVASNGVGLGNILAKYRMLGQKTPTIQEADGQFIVTLPLILAT